MTAATAAAVALQGSESGCRVVLGDLDYLADPELIRRRYDQAWPAWAEQAQQLLQAGAASRDRIVSLYARGRGMSEADLLLKLVELANARPEVEILLHHFDSAAALPALALCRRRPLLSYISGESWVQPQVEALARAGLARLVVQPVDDGGIPEHAEDRLAIAEMLYRRCAAHGMTRADLVVDPLSPAEGTLPFSLDVSVETVRLAHERGFGTIAWPANAGLGRADRDAVAADYARRLVAVGLEMAVVASHDHAVLAAIDAAPAA